MPAIQVEDSARYNWDGSNHTSVNLSALNGSAHDVVILGVYSGTGLSSITDSQSRLSWTNRLSKIAIPNSQGYLEVWYAIVSSLGISSDVISVNFPSSTFQYATAFSIRYAQYLDPFDSDASLPGSATGSTTPPNPSVSINTSYANDMIIGIAVGSNASNGFTQGTNYTLILGAYYTPLGSSYYQEIAEYQVVSATQSGLAVTAIYPPAKEWGIYGDAIKALPTGGARNRTNLRLLLEHD